MIKKLFKEDVIKINNFIYVKEKDDFNIDDGFVIEHNGITYYRLSDVLTLHNCWRLIMQLSLDILIVVCLFSLPIVSKLIFIERYRVICYIIFIIYIVRTQNIDFCLMHPNAKKKFQRIWYFIYNKCLSWLFRSQYLI